MSPVVQPLTVGRIPAVADVLARAFHDDPIWSTLWPDPDRRATYLTRMFAAIVRTGTAAGAHGTVVDGPRAAALWLPPGQELGLRSMLRSRLAMPRMVLRMSPGEARAMLRTVTWLDRRRAALVPAPHWYLWVVGVEPQMHGRGLGTLLVREGLARADKDGVPAYLETETEGNVGFYEGLGFTVLEHVVPPGIAVPLWLMARRPA